MRLPKPDRVNWLAFVLLESDVQGYNAYQDQLEQMEVSLWDWVNMDDARRKMKLDMAERARRMGA